MVVTIKIQLTINGEFYAMGPGIIKQPQTSLESL